MFLCVSLSRVSCVQGPSSRRGCATMGRRKKHSAASSSSNAGSGNCFCLRGGADYKMASILYLHLFETTRDAKRLVTICYSTPSFVTGVCCYCGGCHRTPHPDGLCRFGGYASSAQPYRFVLPSMWISLECVFHSSLPQVVCCFLFCITCLLCTC